MYLLKKSCNRLLIPVIAILLFSGFNESDTPSPVRWQDVAAWKYIPAGSVSISNNGQWLAWWYSPNKGNSDLMVRNLSDNTIRSWQIGEAPGSFGTGGAFGFSDDSRFLAFLVYPDESKPGQSSGSASNQLKLVDLQTDTENTFDNVKNFAFSGRNPGWLAVHLATPKPTQEKEAGKGTDLLLVELSTGNRLTVGNVSDYAFDREGRWLAWLTDTWSKSGNSLQLRDMNSGRIISPDSEKAEYRYLNWTKKGDGLALLKGTDSDHYDKMTWSVIGLRIQGRQDPVKIIYNPHEDPGFPADMGISPNRRPEWSDDLSTLFFGIHENLQKREENDENGEEDGAEPEGENGNRQSQRPSGNNSEKPDLVLWHWQDSRLQSIQKNRESSDRNFSYLSLYHTGEGRFIQLADEEVRSVNPAPGQRYAIGMSNGKYELLSGLSGENFADIYIIDLATGQRRLLLERHRMLGGFTPSPDGNHFVFYSQGNYFTGDFRTGQTRSVTENIPASFVDEENDRNVPLPPTPFFGWTSDSRELLVRDNWNIWKISRDGKKYENLTSDGKRNGKRYQMRFRLDPDEEGIDMRQPLYLRVFDEGTKQSGFARIDRGRSGITTLLWDDALYGGLRKARDTETYIFTRETVTEPGNYYIASNRDLSDPVQVTEIFPEQENYLLSPGSRLISYVSDKGDTLQAALFLPAGYEEGKQYPTVVYIYERLTQGLNSYTRPSLPGGGFNRAMYNSNGYAVLMPDIVYRLNDPGMSAVWCVLPAVDAALETGIIDPDNIAIHGHSWGGYQTSFLITQTDRFKAAVAGAPLTNMISMYSLIYWNTGSTNQPIFESSQGRLTPGYWDNYDAFRRNSPVYFASSVNTPLLLMHNDKDGAVDFTQGVEYYNTLRRLEKPVIMLQYEGENHGLRKPANQMDYAVRMMEFLDHHLKGNEAPRWIEQGIPLLDMEKYLEERAGLFND